MNELPFSERFKFGVDDVIALISVLQEKSNRWITIRDMFPHIFSTKTKKAINGKPTAASGELL